MKILKLFLIALVLTLICFYIGKFLTLSDNKDYINYQTNGSVILEHCTTINNSYSYIKMNLNSPIVMKASSYPNELYSFCLYATRLIGGKFFGSKWFGGGVLLSFLSSVMGIFSFLIIARHYFGSYKRTLFTTLFML